MGMAKKLLRLIFMKIDSSIDLDKLHKKSYEPSKNSLNIAETR